MLCIEAKSLSKSYKGAPAVDGIDLSVGAGAVFGFLGPNGAGKSTTIKMLTTLVRPDAGSLAVLGIDAVASPLEVRRRIGVVLQQHSYEPTLTVQQSLEKYGMMWDVPRAERSERAAALLDDFDLADIRGKRNDDLSIGQRRRVQVAREFMHDMDLLFLDEPTVGLDPAARRILLDRLRARARAGLTIFYTTHVLTEAEYLCDEIAIINRGRIVAVGSPDDLKARFGVERTVRIGVSSVGGAAAARLRAIGGCTVGDGTVTVRSPESGGAQLARALEVLAAAGARIESLSAVPTNLEEAFLRVVGESDAPRG